MIVAMPTRATNRPIDDPSRQAVPCKRCGRVRTSHLKTVRPASPMCRDCMGVEPTELAREIAALALRMYYHQPEPPRK